MSVAPNKDAVMTVCVKTTVVDLPANVQSLVILNLISMATANVSPLAVSFRYSLR